MLKDTKGNILLVEDEENLHEALKLNLELEGYGITSAYTGTQALKAIQNEYFDLVIMDIMLPEVDGISVTENIRVQHLDVPVLILSAKNTGADRVLGLKKGADDYMVKPFNLEELILRVNKLIQKNKQIQTKELIGDTYEFDNNKIDFKAQEAVTWNNQKVELSKKEAMLLKLLIENRGEVVTREKYCRLCGATMCIPQRAPLIISFSTFVNISSPTAATRFIFIRYGAWVTNTPIECIVSG